jgi:hypothetical protein
LWLTGCHVIGWQRNRVHKVSVLKHCVYADHCQYVTCCGTKRIQFCLRFSVLARYCYAKCHAQVQGLFTNMTVRHRVSNLCRVCPKLLNCVAMVTARLCTIQNHVMQPHMIRATGFAAAAVDGIRLPVAALSHLMRDVCGCLLDLVTLHSSRRIVCLFVQSRQLSPGSGTTSIPRGNDFGCKSVDADYIQTTAMAVAFADVS